MGLIKDFDEDGKVVCRTFEEQLYHLTDAHREQLQTNEELNEAIDDVDADLDTVKASYVKKPTSDGNKYRLPFMPNDHTAAATWKEIVDGSEENDSGALGVIPDAAGEEGKVLKAGTDGKYSWEDESVTAENLLEKIDVSDGGLSADLSEDESKVEIHLDAEYISITLPNGSQFGTLTNEQKNKLHNDNCVIILDGEYYKLSKGLLATLSRQYVSANKNTLTYIKIIDVNLITGSWTYSFQELREKYYLHTVEIKNGVSIPMYQKELSLRFLSSSSSPFIKTNIFDTSIKKVCIGGKYYLPPTSTTKMVLYGTINPLTSITLFFTDGSTEDFTTGTITSMTDSVTEF